MRTGLRPTPARSCSAPPDRPRAMPGSRRWPFPRWGTATDDRRPDSIPALGYRTPRRCTGRPDRPRRHRSAGRSGAARCCASAVASPPALPRPRVPWHTAAAIREQPSAQGGSKAVPARQRSRRRCCAQPPAASRKGPRAAANRGRGPPSPSRRAAVPLRWERRKAATEQKHGSCRSAALRPGNRAQQQIGGAPCSASPGQSRHQSPGDPGPGQRHRHGPNWLELHGCARPFRSRRPW